MDKVSAKTTSGALANDGGPVSAGRLVEARIFGSMVRLTLAVPGWAGARPGQFAMLRPEGSVRFLPRAFSVHDEPAVHSSASEPLVSFLVSPIGPGTRELARLRLGDPVAVVGPLGRGFDLAEIVAQAGPPTGPPSGAGGSDDAPRLLLVGGGVGVAPFILPMRVAARLHVKGSAVPLELVLLFGFRDASQAAVLDPFEAAAAELAGPGLRVEIHAICEDGSLGRAGLVTTLLEEELRPRDRVLCCGAHAMCEAVWGLCLGRGVRAAWFSLEAGMACGVGSCQGCVIPAVDGRLVRVCREGPVFHGEEMFGDAVRACAGVDNS